MFVKVRPFPSLLEPPDSPGVTGPTCKRASGGDGKTFLTAVTASVDADPFLDRWGPLCFLAPV